ncbi:MULTISPECIES: CcdB family protein [Pseudomonas nitroreducens/multiresinivorans group]|uniref:Toxin CcdB n=1 Tax=Pseudomonas multiresinivorans TaxID=95301 RepID=A0A7Z3BQH7_9PSED|nr:CcdB family protein [Pseudomonas multiresinivorans]QJP11082.1 plasmid maintenance protein CcdB [Pseudomonas multiresinivorans]
MKQFDLYRNDNPRTREAMPLLLDVQSDLLDSLNTRMVIPLSRAKGLAGINRLMPEVTVGEERLLLLTPQMAGISRRELGEPVGSLAHLRLQIIAAIDLLISGI